MPTPRPALSVRQPFAEQILRGLKIFEYRSMPTRRRGRVYLYAARGIDAHEREWRKLGMSPADAVRGRIVGSVEIAGCEWSGKLGCYRWLLRRPRRLRPIRPRNHPQPVWFYPFNSVTPTKRILQLTISR